MLLATDISAFFAKALTAAEAIALPPRRPESVKKGTVSQHCFTSNFFDSTAPTKPTGKPKITAGGSTPSVRISSRRNNVVGALPTATTAPASCGRQNSTAAAERGVYILFASGAHFGWFFQHLTSLFADRRERIIPSATILESHKTGAPLSLSLIHI